MDRVYIYIWWLYVFHIHRLLLLGAQQRTTTCKHATRRYIEATCKLPLLHYCEVYNLMLSNLYKYLYLIELRNLWLCNVMRLEDLKVVGFFKCEILCNRQSFLRVPIASNYHRSWEESRGQHLCKIDLRNWSSLLCLCLHIISLRSKHWLISRRNSYQNWCPWCVHDLFVFPFFFSFSHFPREMDTTMSIHLKIY